MESTGKKDLDALLDEQAAYYRAVAPEYENGMLSFPGGAELTEALDAFRPTGSVLELACGPGIWTNQLLQHATDVTAVDGSPEMLAIASARVADKRVRFVSADLFGWRPDRRYDVGSLGSGCRTCRPNASRLFGRSWPTASSRPGGFSSSTTRTARPTS